MSKKLIIWLAVIGGLVTIIFTGLSFSGSFAVWQNQSQSYFEKDDDQAKCEIGHCSVLPATKTSWCPSGYSKRDGRCERRADSSRKYFTTKSYTLVCNTSSPYYKFKIRDYCVYYYSPNGGTTCLSGYEYNRYLDQYYGIPGETCFKREKPKLRNYECPSSYPNGGGINSSLCWRVVYYCSDKSEGAKLNRKECWKPYSYTYRDNAGDGNYAKYAIIRSKDVNDSSRDKSEWFRKKKVDSVEKATALVQLLRDYYDGTHKNIDKVKSQGGKSLGGDTSLGLSDVKAYAKTGVAFIVNAMLGRGQGSDKNVTSGDFDALQAILEHLAEAGKIKWRATIDNDGNEVSNTHSVKVLNSKGNYVYDIGAFDADIDGRKGIIIRNDADEIVFRILYACANPFGAGSGLGDYILDPSISVTPDGIAESSSVVRVLPTVNNVGDSGSGDVPWEVSRFIMPPGSSIPGGSPDTTQNPAQFFGNGLIRIANGSRSFPIGITDLNFLNDTIPNLPLGSIVCYALSLDGYSSSDEDWRHSDPDCVVVGVKPKVQIWGSDLFGGRAFIGMPTAPPVAKIQTSTSVKDVAGTNRVFGSWVEYGVLASGAISGIGSGSAYANPGLAGATDCNSSPFTFSNAFDTVCDGSVEFGGFTSPQPIPDVAASFPVTGSTDVLSGSVDLSNGSLDGIYTASSALTLTGGSVTPGRWVVINAPNANVTITGNITYGSGQIGSINNIPQLVVIARNINIRGSVDRIDGWLIAKGADINVDGAINTCSDVAVDANLSSAVCNNQLVVNGPVMANSLYLRRTTGSGASNGSPAEIINLRADAYLWAETQAVSKSRAHAVYSIELPPRL